MRNNGLTILEVGNTDQKNLESLYLLINEKKGMAIRNARYIDKHNLQRYLSQHKKAGSIFYLITDETETILGFFKVDINLQHLSAHLNFGFDWDIPTLSTVFIESFEILREILISKFKIERILIPITGTHTDIEALIQSHPKIIHSITLQQEHLDKDGIRQPVTYYDYFTDNEE